MFISTTRVLTLWGRLPSIWYFTHTVFKSLTPWDELIAFAVRVTLQRSID